MKEFTKTLRNEYDKDFKALHSHNNSKISKRTPEQNAQAHNDKVNFLLKKWNELSGNAETTVQKTMCNRMLGIIMKAPKWY